MKINLAILLCVLTCHSFSQQLQWNWIKSAGGGYAETCNCIAVDQSGDIYLGGDYYSGICPFDSIVLNNTGIANTCDVFIAKYDVNGNAIFAKAGHGKNTDRIFQITATNDGVIFATGYTTSDTLLFDSSAVTKQFYVAAFDQSGHLLWTKNISNGGAGLAITHDAKGNCIVAGHLSLDSICTLTDTLINTQTNANAVVFKIDSAGNLLSGKIIVGQDGLFESVNAGSDGSIIVSGYFNSDSLVIGNTTLINHGYGGDLFLIKFDSTGNILWTQSMGGPSFERNSRVTTDQSGNVYVSGSFVSLDFYIGQDTLVNTDTIFPVGSSLTSEVFLAKLSPAGTLQWVKQWKGKSTEDSPCTPVIINDHIYFALNFASDTIRIDNYSYVSSSLPDYSILLTCLDTNGQVLFNKVYVAGEVTDIYGTSQEFIMTGVPKWSVFSLGGMISAVGAQQKMFVAEASILPLNVNDIDNPSDLTIYPNPTDNFVRIISSEKIVKLTLYDLSGRAVYTMNNKGNEELIQIPNPGIYILSVTCTDSNYSRIIIRQ